MVVACEKDLFEVGPVSVGPDELGGGSSGSVAAGGKFQLRRCRRTSTSSGWKTIVRKVNYRGEGCQVQGGRARYARYGWRTGLEACKGSLECRGRPFAGSGSAAVRT